MVKVIRRGGSFKKPRGLMDPLLLVESHQAGLREQRQKEYAHA